MPLFRSPITDYRSFEEQRGLSLIRETLKLGINYVETGPWYGQGSSERTIGMALKGVPRNSFYIASKVGRYEREPEKMFDFSAEKTEFGVDNTLKLLGVEYLDVIQVHDVTFAPDTSIILKETLPTLQKAVNDGKARYIGIADYNIDLLKEIVEESEVKISVVLSYAKSTLLDNRLQNYALYFKRRGIGVINAAATGMGLLTNKGPPSWHPASDEIKALCREAAEFCRSHKVELARLATHFAIHQPHIDTNVCGFLNAHQLYDTMEVMRKGLTKIEEKVYEEVKTRYFSKGVLHWDNVELPNHKRKLLQD
ncbi:unnamed protein product, partial [Brenthis ino]